jgi:hypothetical protein
MNPKPEMSAVVSPAATQFGPAIARFLPWLLLHIGAGF